MRNIMIAVASSAALLTASATPALSHHNANAQYHMEKEISVAGTLQQVRDIQPHAQWKVTATNSKGAVEHWALETIGVNALRRAGIKVKTDIKVGNKYTFYFSPSRDGSLTGFLHAISINGKRVQFVPK